MMKTEISKLVVITVPITACNLHCHYCCISISDGWKADAIKIKQSPQFIRKALSKERLGGVSLVNITGWGETLLPPTMPEIIKELLEEGHYMEVVTNGTLSNRFDEIAKISSELLSHLEFKFSFHYQELTRLGKLDEFFENVKKMHESGCSFTLELMPNDELIPSIDSIKALCLEKVGAFCHLTVGRDDKDGRSLLTSMSREEYVETWGTFGSKMFEYKMDIYNVKRREFCYAGMWTIYVNLSTGDAAQCYGIKPNQNIYKDLNKPIIFRPVGHGCKEPFCYNGHAFLTMGVIPELQSPTYADIRNRTTIDGDEWFSKEAKEAFSYKLYDSNQELSKTQKVLFYLTYPVNVIRMLETNKFYIPRIKKKIKRLFKK